MLFYKDVEYISGFHYVLLKAPLGRAPNTVPQGYGKYFRLLLYLAENSAGERVRYSSTRIWDVF